MEVDGNSNNQVISGYVAKIYSVLLDQFEFNLTGKARTSDAKWCIFKLFMWQKY